MTAQKGPKIFFFCFKDEKNTIRLPNKRLGRKITKEGELKTKLNL